MKGYKKFIVAFCILLALYIIAELNRPKELEWNISLSKEDKNPFGSFVLFKLLPHLFPESEIISSRRPVVNTLEDHETNKASAYILLEPEINLSREDRNAILKYAAAGNYVVMAGQNIDKAMSDTLKLKAVQSLQVPGKQTSVRLVNPLLTQDRFKQTGRVTIDGYFEKVDYSRSSILGENSLEQTNYIEMKVGKGRIFIHLLPLCFSNIFLLEDKNAEYASSSLSYLPENLQTIFWDEYYKLGPEGSTNPMRFFLQDPWLKWCYWIALVAIISLLLYESKRRQRIIPTIKPLRNSSLDFVNTVGDLYYNTKNHRNLALNKINYFTEFIRSTFFLATSPMNEKFISDLSAKSGFPEKEVASLVEVINYIQDVDALDEKTLMHLTKEIDRYYERFGR